MLRGLGEGQAHYALCNTSCYDAFYINRYCHVDIRRTYEYRPAHEPGIELATRLAAMTPGDLNRAFLTPTGGDAVETALKLSRQYWKLRGQHSRTKMISRYLAYHGTSMGGTITLPPSSAAFAAAA